jgi:hypothetical protein
MQPNDENLPENNIESPQSESGFTPGAQPFVQPGPTTQVPPVVPSVDGFSPAPAPTPPSEPTSFQPPVTAEVGTNPEPFQTPAAPALVEPPKHVGFFGRLFGKK